jgi:3-oxoacyl-[acyl-carrier protein] reductase
MTQKSSYNYPGYILITGAGSGIGLAIAESLLSLGINNLICQYRNRKNDLQELFKKYNLDPENHTFKAELTEEQQLKELRSFGNAKFKNIFALINVAGASTNSMSWKMKKDEFVDIINANLLTCFLCSKEFIPDMRAQAYGKIINFSSIVAFTGIIGSAHYSASKAGIVGLSKSLSLELANKNINVNTIALGYFDRGLINDVPENIQNEIKEKTPLKRFGTADEVSSVVNYLLSNNSNFTTGQVFHLNGGLY